MTLVSLDGPPWVKSRKTPTEPMFSAIPPTADVRHGISKAYRFTLQMPACVTVDAIGRVDPAATDALPLARFGQVISGAAEIVRQRRDRRACQSSIASVFYDFAVFYDAKTSLVILNTATESQSLMPLP
jgi:hypothetical protein